MRRLFYRLVFLVMLYTLMRFAFLVVHWQHVDHVSIGDVLRSFLVGLRFDLSAIVLINVPFFLLDAFEFRFDREVFVWIERLLFTAFNSFFLIINLGDIEYFSFTGQRLTLLSLLGIAGDLRFQLASLVAYYWGLVLSFLAISTVLWLLSGRSIGAAPSSTLGVRYRIVQTIVIAGLGVLAIRGGIQGKPLSTAHAMAAGQGILRHLALNSSFTLLKSYSQDRLEYEEIHKHWSELEAHLSADHPDPSPSFGQLAGSNVVVLILESFNFEFLGTIPDRPSYAPFVARLGREGLMYERFFASGRRSIDALPAIFAGMPSLLGDPFIVSGFESVDLLGFPRLLANRGYATAFFHGGNDGTMYFDVMSKMFGFEQYYDAGVYPHESHYDGQWGIFDEPYLDYVAKEISTLTQPFLVSAFTLSSHHPYVVPERYVGVLKEGPKPVHRTIAYTDMAVEKFFERARLQSWFADTLFVLTADHTTESVDDFFSHGLGRFRVPLIFWHPKVDLREHLAEPRTLSSHVDIGPTLLDLLGVTYPQHTAFGHSLARDRRKTPIFLPGEEGIWMIDGKNLFSNATAGKMQVYDWENDPRLSKPQPAPESAETEFRTWLQYFGQGLHENKLLIAR